MQTSYLLHDMTLGVAPLGADPRALPELIGPARVQVTYDYEPGFPTVHTLPNGDPGDEPGAPECMTILNINSPGPLHFADDDEGILMTLACGAGCNLLHYLDEGTIAQIEERLLAERRAAVDDARADAWRERRP